MTGRINSKVALITGAGSGIGKSCSVLFAKHGAKLSLADVKKDSMIELSKKEVDAIITEINKKNVAKINTKSLEESAKKVLKN